MWKTDTGPDFDVSFVFIVLFVGGSFRQPFSEYSDIAATRSNWKMELK